MMRNDLLILALIGVGGILSYKIIDQYGVNFWDKTPKTSYPAPCQSTTMSTTIPQFTSDQAPTSTACDIPQPCSYTYCSSPCTCEPQPCSYTCCSSPCTCEPQPEQCIDCVCYTPPYYDLECACGIFVDVEFLYWYARETNTAYAAVITTQEFGEIRPAGVDVALQFGPISALKRIKTSWDPGVRVGLGYNFQCDGWDVYLNWTYFKNSSKSSASESQINFTAVGESRLINPWFTATTSDTLGLFFNKILASWSVQFNQIDLDLGRKYWLSPCFTLRPFIGLRGAWTDTHFKMNSTSLPHLVGVAEASIFLTSLNDELRFRNQLWGIGFMTGIEPNWYMCSNFALFGNLDVALLWGQHKVKKKENFTAEGRELETPRQFSYQISTHQDACYQLSTLLDVAIGIRWEETWCCNRYRTSLDLGWEHHNWFHHSTRYLEQMSPFIRVENTSQSYSTQFLEEDSDLGYGGLIVRLRFDF